MSLRSSAKVVLMGKHMVMSNGFRTQNLTHSISTGSPPIHPCPCPLFAVARCRPPTSALRRRQCRGDAGSVGWWPSKIALHITLQNRWLWYRIVAQDKLWVWRTGRRTRRRCEYLWSRWGSPVAWKCQICSRGLRVRSLGDPETLTRTNTVLPVQLLTCFRSFYQCVSLNSRSVKTEQQQHNEMFVHKKCVT